MTLTCTMYLGDCLDVMKEEPHNKFDFGILDLPYGVSGYEWDIPLSLCAVYAHLGQGKRKRFGWVSFGNEAHHIRCLDAWRHAHKYTLVWNKITPMSFWAAKIRPMIAHEFIGVYGHPVAYNPLKTYGHPILKGTHAAKGQSFYKGYINKQAGKRKDYDDSRFPCSIITCPHDKRKRQSRLSSSSSHPSQKPVALLDWLIRTYSNPGDHVLDPVSGSATTAVAGLTCGRSVTCIEKDPTYFEAGVERVRKHIADNQIDAKVEVRR